MGAGNPHPEGSGWTAACVGVEGGGNGSEGHSRTLVCPSGRGVGQATQSNCNSTAAQVRQLEVNGAKVGGCTDEEQGAQARSTLGNTGFPQG